MRDAEQIAIPESPAAPMRWGVFYLRCAAATAVLTLVAVKMFVLAHEYLYDWSEVDPRRGRGLGLGVRALVITQRAVRALLEILDPSWMVWAIALGAPVLAIVLIGLRIRAAESAGGAGLAAQLGARPIEQTSLNRLDIFLLECVAAEAKARDIAAPPVLVLDELDTVCAATLGTRRQDAALLLSMGARERLDPYALRAVLAWQLDALEGGRLERDVRLAAFVHPLMVPWLLADAIWNLEQWLRRFELEGSLAVTLLIPLPLRWFFISVRFALHALRLMLRIAGFPGLAMARLILRNALKDDVFVRDHRVAAAHTDREALAAALARALPREEELDDIDTELFAANASAVEFGHMFFAEPLPIPHEPRLQWIAARLRSHVDPLERIRAISPKFDLEAYEKRRATADAGAALPAMAHGAPDESRLAQGPLRPAPVQGVVRFDAGDPAEASLREEFFLRFSRTLLEHFRTPQGASRLLLAAAVPSAPGGDALKAELEKLGARERRWVIERSLVPLAAAPEQVRAAHLRAHRILIEADRRITLDELADWLFVERVLMPLSTPAVAGSTWHADASLILATLAWAGAKDEKAAASAYARGIAAIAPESAAALPDRRTLSAADIERALHRLQVGGIATRADFVKACIAVARSDGSISETEEELLRRFCFILSIAPGVLRPASSSATAGAKPVAADTAASYAPPADSAPIRTAPAKGAPTIRSCTRCAGRAELRCRTQPLRDMIADWLIPFAACVAIGLALFLMNAPHRSLRPGAWTTFFGAWAALSVLFGVVYSLLVDTGPRIHFPRWMNVSVLIMLLAASVVFYFLIPEQRLGVPLGSMLVIGGILVYELTKKPRIPPGCFYFCRGCGLIGRIDDTIRGMED